MSKGDFKKRKVDALEGIESTCGEISLTTYGIASKLDALEKRVATRECLEDRRRKTFHVVQQVVEEDDDGDTTTHIYLNRSRWKEEGTLDEVFDELQGTIVSTVFDPKSRETTWIVEK
jgi:hypothetical protein